ncbi:FAD-binding oxidoreductase [Legionella jordanis]|nr:FAD-binding oxidoreductase [Legionella jordanis]RMX03761.1 ferredoxin [Legionella jordanis]RMX22177.1 ferredoxin [Legionella jordanis]
MAELNFNHQNLQALEGESVLDCLLRHGIDYPHSCCAGICQACLMKATEGVVEAKWQDGLPDTLKAQGYFLACQAKPEANIMLKSPDASECDQQALINDIKRLTHNVIRVKLLTGNLEVWIPGQYLNLMNSKGILRSYSIANLPAKEGFIELHIKLKENGEMSRWLGEEAAVDTMVHIRGPFGKCYYLNPAQASFDMLLVGTGTGLAPLLAIAKSALSEQHNGTIHLIHGGCVDEDIYYSEELQMLASIYENFKYSPCVLKTRGNYPEANIFDKTGLNLTAANKDIRVYVCGPKDTTNKIKTQVFLAGVPSARIYSDAFL